MILSILASANSCFESMIARTALTTASVRCGSMTVVGSVCIRMAGSGANATSARGHAYLKLALEADSHAGVEYRPSRVVGRRDRRRPQFAPLDREERRAEDTWSAGHIDIKAADYPEEQNGKSRDEQTQDIEDHVGQADPATRFPRLDSIRSLGKRGHLAHTAPRGLQRNCERCAHKPP